MCNHHQQVILQALQQVQAHAGKSSAGVYIHKILQTITQVEAEDPADPVLEVLFALYDALAYNDLWLTYTADQYQQAHQVMIRIVNESLNSHQFEEAIAALEAVGFDTMPYTYEPAT
jgi:hypothetical protein